MSLPSLSALYANDPKTKKEDTIIKESPIDVPTPVVNNDILKADVPVKPVEPAPVTTDAPVKLPELIKADNKDVKPETVGTPPTPMAQEKPILEEPKVDLDLQKKGVKEDVAKVSPLSDLPVSPLAGVEFKPVGTKSDSDTMNQKADISVQYGVGEEKGKESTDEPYKMFDLLDKVIALNASDLHLTVGYPPYIRVDGKLILSGSTPITPKQMEKLLEPILGTKNQEQLEINKEVDFSYGYGEMARFRVNAFNQRNTVAAALRLIPTKIPTLEELYMPKAMEEFTKLPQGFVLVVGPTGSGKSTTLASMINLINNRDARHILTVEDPIEYVYPIAKSIVEQREVSQDTHSWDIALRSALREDPNVVLVGEMRDYETIAAALTVAETGHLVFATLHTNSASQAVDRIIHVFPAEQQAQIRIMLANVITAVVSQRLIPTIGGGRRAAFEILVGTSAVANMIREAKEHLIDNVIQTSADVGMMTMEKSLVDLIREGKITVDDAQNFTTKPEELMRLINKD